ncbi:MAG: Spy/CpxP family protein refolding chaperone [Psychromonas sp.]|nr:Spy/CpxP family protein refolding chaperone [Psychromonas sp.]
MKTNTKKLKFIALAISFSLAGASFAYAGSKKPEYKKDHESIYDLSANCNEYGGGYHKRSYELRALKKRLSQLHLTKAQQKKIKTISEEKTLKAKSLDMRRKQQAHMQTLVEKPAFDDTIARAIIGQREANQHTRQILSMKVYHAIYQVLTKDQQKKLQEQMHKRIGKRHNKHKTAY